MTDTVTPEIIFEDTHLLVINKPAGLLSQGDHSGSPNLVDWLREYLGRPYVGLVHRLDRNTSGLLVVGKRTKSATRLSKAIQKHQIHRAYIGIVFGNLQNSQKWLDWLIKDENENISKVVDPSTTGAKKAVLTVEPIGHTISRDCPLTYCKFSLETGRSHQIRVQCAKQGFPIIGDSKYGTKTSAALFTRPALHAAHLSFPHPMSHDLMNYFCPIPSDMKKLVSESASTEILKLFREGLN